MLMPDGKIWMCFFFMKKVTMHVPVLEENGKRRLTTSYICYWHLKLCFAWTAGCLVYLRAM